MAKPDIPRRTRDPGGTRGRILEAAFAEVYRHGFQAASLDAILARAGVTKGALYHHFPSKAALGYAVVEEVIARILVQRWTGRLGDDPPDPVAALLEVLQTRATDLQELEGENGCPLNNIAQEMAPLDEGFQRRIAAAYEQWIGIFAGALEAGQRRGAIRADVRPREAATFIVSAIEGSYSLAKGQGSLEPLRTNLAALQAWVGTLAAGEARRGDPR